MTDLSTQYMGLTLKSPIIVGSCGLTYSIDTIKKLEANGAAAIVLKSLFEEQIMLDSDSLKSDFPGHVEEMDYIRGYTRQNAIDEYLALIEKAKKETSIPIFASVNCISASDWTLFAKKIEAAGADGIELNMFILPGNIKMESEEYEQLYFDIVKKVKKQVTIPIAVKLGFYFTAMANMICKLSVRDVDAIVLFNRFFRPDVDIVTQKLIPADRFSTPQENALPLRWIGMVADKVECDLAATTGIHDGHTAIKNILVGASAVQVVSAVYQKGPKVLAEMTDQIIKWMEIHKYNSITDFKGKLSYDHTKDPLLYDRTQFMKYYSNSE